MLDLRNHNPKNISPNANNAYPSVLWREEKKISNPPIPITGMTAALMSNHSPKNVTSPSTTVVPMLAPIINPIHSVSPIVPAPTKAKIIKHTTELLCKMVVTTVPMMMDLRVHLVYFLMSSFIVPDVCDAAVSKISNPARNIPSHPKN